MKVVIAGAGQVGFNIGRYLAGGGYDITIIDKSEELVRRIGDTLDIQAMVGNAASPSVLEQAGAADADLLIAVTHSDEVNMVACEVAHALFDVPTKIARVRQQDYLQPRFAGLFGRDRLPIDVVISPEREVAGAVALRLAVPGALTVVPFADDKVRLVAVRAGEDCPVNDTPLRQLTYLFPDLHMNVVAIGRGDRLFLPDADDGILAQDEVYFVAETAHVARALRAFGHEGEAGQRVVVAGGGNIGLFLARELEARRPDVALKLIELDPARAEQVALQLRHAVVLKGDVRDPTILEEATVAACEAFVTVTNNDEINIMAALLARRLGARRTLALVNNGTYGAVTRSIGIDVTINPRDTTISSILQHVRRGRIKAVHTVRDGEAEVYEAEALETSPLVGRPLKDVKLAGRVIVGALVREGKVITPRPETVTKAHDRVILAASADAAKRVEQLFAVRLDYL